jgi:hypothetical protein
MEQKMTKILKWVGGAGLAAALGLVLFGLSGALGASDAAAESPPAPPAKFAGSVLVDGAAPAAGTVIEAKIGSASCGVATVFLSGAEARYVLEVPALDPAKTPNCGTEGGSVTFYVGGKMASQTGSWLNYQLNVLDLTVVTPTEAPTPQPPSVGSGLAGNGSIDATWLFAALGLGAIAFGIAGAQAVRRSR